MNTRARFLTVVAGLVLFACAGNDAAEQQLPADTAAAAVPADTAAATDTAMLPAGDCVRGEPEPFFANSRFQKTAALEATETVDTKSPIALTVRHGGCAHFGLAFEFVWSAGAMPDRAAALNATASLLESLPPAEVNGTVLHAIVSSMRTLAADSSTDMVSMSEMETLTVATPAANTLVVRYDVAL